jgi:threonyl-tRNA synthetase
MDHDDHRSIGRRLDLFHFQDDAPGMAFWHPRGLALYRVLEEASRRHVRRHGYLEVRSPQVLRQAMWERSGHWDHFREHMFVLSEDEGRVSALKPVSCPGHLAIAKRMSLSYRDLPLRLAELGMCHRNEQSGVLSGLLRLRQFVQDDGHVLCERGQVVGEIARFCASLPAFYRAFGFDHLDVALAGRPESRVGDDAAWDLAEAQLAEGARQAGMSFEFVPGGGAFYGPKLEVSLVDRAGRAWQCGTIQLDFFLPERFDVAFVDASGQRARPAMLHRALYGSLERFLGILLEHHRGRLPAWLAPVQIMVAPVRTEHAAPARELWAELCDAGLRAELDGPAESLSKRIAESHEMAIPYVLVLGDREIEARSVHVRGPAGRSSLDRGEVVGRLRELMAPAS